MMNYFFLVFFCFFRIFIFQPLDPAFIEKKPTSTKTLSTREENWIINDEMYQMFYSYFDLNVRGNYEINYCSEIQKFYQNSDFSIHSIFHPILASFLGGRCKKGKGQCDFNNYWNITNQDDLTSNVFIEYYSTYFYYNFPLISFVIFLIFFASIMNCFYLNFCYSFFCCNKTQKSVPFSKLVILLLISLVLYVIIGVFIIYRLKFMKTLINRMLCEVVSTTVFMPLVASNLTSMSNVHDINQNWKGLIEIHNSFDALKNELKIKKTKFLELNISVEGKNSLPYYYEAVDKGFDEFYIKYFEAETSLSFKDTNCNLRFINNYYNKLSKMYEEAQKELRDYIKPFEDNYTKGLQEIINVFSENDEDLFDFEYNLRAEVYKSLKHYNIVEVAYNEYKGYYSTSYAMQLLIFGTNLLLVFLCIFFFQKMKNRINDVSKKIKRKVKLLKWFYHGAINFNLLTSLLYIIVSCILFFLGSALYEGGITFEENFFNKFLIFNFSSFSNGKLIDECNANKTIESLLTYNTSFNLFISMEHKIEELINLPSIIRTRYDELKKMILNISPKNFTTHQGKLQWDKFKLSEFWLSGQDDVYNYSLLQNVCNFNYDGSQYNYDTLNNYTHKTGSHYNNSCSNQFDSCFFYAKNSESSKKYNLNKIFKEKVEKDFTIESDYLSRSILGENCIFIWNCTDFDSYSEAAIYYLQKAFNPFFDELLVNNMLKIFIQDFQTFVIEPYDEYFKFFMSTNQTLISFKSTNYEGDDNLAREEIETFQKLTECDFMGNFTRTIEYVSNVFGEEFFGLSLCYIGMAIILFINSSFVVLTAFHLQSAQEISSKESQENIKKQLEKLEDSFHKNESELIDEDDLRILNKVNPKDEKEGKKLNVNHNMLDSKIKGIVNKKNEEIELFKNKINSFLANEYINKKEVKDKTDFNSYTNQEEENEEYENEEVEENDEGEESDEDIDYDDYITQTTNNIQTEKKNTIIENE